MKTLWKFIYLIYPNINIENTIVTSFPLRNLLEIINISQYCHRWRGWLEKIFCMHRNNRTYKSFKWMTRKPRPRKSLNDRESNNWLKFQKLLYLPAKHPLEERALAFKTGFMETRLQGLNRLLFRLSPLVALANIIKFPSSPPGEHSSGSCCAKKKEKGGKY